MKEKIIFITVLFLGLVLKIKAQYRAPNEVGISIGAVNYQTDYGERGSFSKSLVNTGFGVEAFYYLNSFLRSTYTYKDSYFEEHFKLRAEFAYSKSNLKHYGRWVEPSKISNYSKLLRSMEGNTAVSSLGIQLEYYPLATLSDFDDGDNKWAFFISGGAQVCYYNPKVYSTLGDFGTIKTTFSKYLDPTGTHIAGFSNDNGFTCAFTAGLGIRRAINDNSDLVFSIKQQFFTSDWVEGVNPDRKLHPENKYNDSTTWITLGYIHYLRFF